MLLRPDGGHRVLFIEVPEDKQIKNRIHFDLRPTAGTRNEELKRLRDLGATWRLRSTCSRHTRSPVGSTGGCKEEMPKGNRVR